VGLRGADTGCLGSSIFPWVVCAACHGVEGKAMIPNYPHLAGQNAAYLVKQLQAFKDGTRKEPLMVPFMAPLTDADMENLAAFYASLK